LIELVYYTQGQGLLSQRRNNASYFYHYDGLGSTKALTDANQNVQSSTKYDAWGNILQASGTITNPYLYVGELGYYGDGDAGMYLLTQRWYNPLIGRFVVRDPLKRGSADTYAYCHDDPLVLVDPLGQRCIHIFGDCIGKDCHGDPRCPPSHETQKQWAERFKFVMEQFIDAMEEGKEVDIDVAIPLIFGLKAVCIPGKLAEVREQCLKFLQEVVKAIRNDEPLYGLSPDCTACCKSIADAVGATVHFCREDCMWLLQRPRIINFP
jgi:RHS repeat-associated protein